MINSYTDLITVSWNSLVTALKLIFFNPGKLTTAQLTKEVIRILSAGAAAFIGIAINQQLAQLFAFPFGTEIAAFLSALITGVIILGLTYFLDHSAVMKNIWKFLARLKIKSQSTITLEYYKEVNNKLDVYLVELSRIEFNFNPLELKSFSDALLLANDEVTKGAVLAKEIKRRSINLPYKMGNTDSTIAWLKRL